MVKAAPPAALIMSEPDFLLELLVVAFDAPAQLGVIDQTIKGDVLRQVREPVAGAPPRPPSPLSPLPHLPRRRGPPPRPPGGTGGPAPPPPPPPTPPPHPPPH